MAGMDDSLFSAMDVMVKYYARIEENRKYYRGGHPLVYKKGDRVICLYGIDEKKADIEEFETVVVESETRNILTGEPHKSAGPCGTVFIAGKGGSFCQTQDCMLRPAAAGSDAISKESYAAAARLKDAAFRGGCNL
jgi:hypothetical protein